MSTATAADSRTEALGRLSPFVLLAVAMPWLLEEGIVRTVSVVAPAYEPVVTAGTTGAILYPVVTGSVVVAALYLFFDPTTRRSLFLFRRPSRRELLAVVVAVPVGMALQSAVIAAFTVLFDIEGGTTVGGSFSPLVFAITALVFAPVVEEVLFRGLLLGYLVERGVPTLVAAGIVAAAFGAIHYYGGPANAAGAAAWAMIPIALRLRYDSLVSPVLFHSLSNLIVLLVLLSG